MSTSASSQRSRREDVDWDLYIDAQQLIVAAIVGETLRAHPELLELVCAAASSTWHPYDPSDSISKLNTWCMQHQLEVCWPKRDAAALCAPAFPAGHVLLRDVVDAFRTNTTTYTTPEEASPHLP